MAQHGRGRSGRETGFIGEIALFFLRRFDALFHERELIVRSDGRVRMIRLSRTGQVAFALLSAGGVGWGCFASVAHFLDVHALARMEHAHAALRAEVTRTETRFSTLARTLEAKHAYLMAMLAREGELERIPGDESARDGNGHGYADGIRKRLTESRNALLTQLGELERALGRDGMVHDAGEAALHAALPPLDPAARARLETARERLLGRLDRLEDRLAGLNRSQKRVTRRLAERTNDHLAWLRSVIAGTGIDIDAVMARLGGTELPGTGGPFIAAGRDAGTGAVIGASPAIARLDAGLTRWGRLQRLMQVLPLAAPADHFYVASGFGKRRDPFNNRWSMHYGVDLAGIYRSPVRANAPGIVVRAGWNGNYGRMVEIDHGAGIHTRYGHLHRILVKRGQRVGFRQEIGEMGSSGRSTGTHVHYEILIDGKPHDPMKFLLAGEHVFEEGE